MRQSLTLSRVLVALTLLTAAAPAVFAQQAKSAAPAKELSQLLAGKKMDAIAARDPNAADTFIAALAFPSQIIVVSARYSSPPLLNEKLAQGNYRDVYVDLNSASIQESRFFVTDLGSDGLRAKKAKKDDPNDMREAAGKTFLFDGSWREDKMSEADYMKVFAETDEQYTRMLSVLLEQAKK